MKTTFGCLDCGELIEAGTIYAHIFEHELASGQHPACPTCGNPLWDLTPSDNDPEPVLWDCWLVCEI